MSDMCGRYTLRHADRIKLKFRGAIDPLFEEFTEHPRFNVAPSQFVPVVRLNQKDERVLGALKWGLIPYFTKGKPAQQRINARAESVATNGMFRQAFQRRRCLVPVDGFYEWQRSAKIKQPFFFSRPDDEPFAFAGIWERWQPDPAAEPIETTCHITTTPNAVMKPIHDRMPVILHERDYDRWLDRSQSGADVAVLLRPIDDDALTLWPVSTAVNSVKNDDKSLAERIIDSIDTGNELF